MKHGAHAHLCEICHLRPRLRGDWCVQCRESYDRARRTDAGTVLAAINWGARRARRFALQETHRAHNAASRLARQIGTRR